MALSDLISPEAILPALKANSKKQALQAIAEKAAAITGVEEREILETLLQREKLGSTGVGGGIAIPHGKLARLFRISGLFARLAKPIDFEALDDQPVDLIFLLLAPEGAGAEQLKALARIARHLREPGVAGKLRASADLAALYAVLTEGAASNAA
jgi:PTS system nitrogen regulatory IIA component